MSEVERGVQRALDEARLPPTRADAIGGCCVWSWPCRRSPPGRRLSLLLCPCSEGVQLALQALVWASDSDEAIRRVTYLERFYRHDQLSAKDVADVLTAALAAAWYELETLQGPRVTPYTDGAQRV